MKVMVCELAVALRVGDQIEFRSVRLGPGAAAMGVASSLPPMPPSRPWVTPGVEIELPDGDADAPVPDELCRALVFLWGLIRGIEQYRNGTSRPFASTVMKEPGREPK